MRGLERGAARAELVPVAYDWRAQATSMRAAGLPEPLVETIETGWWTTCLEVLPPPERARGRFHSYSDALPSRSSRSSCQVAPVQPLLQPTDYGSKTIAGTAGIGDSRGVASDQTNLGRRLER